MSKHWYDVIFVFMEFTYCDLNRVWKDSQQIPRWLQYIDGDGLIYELTLQGKVES